MQDLANIDWDKTLDNLVEFATSSEGKEQLKRTTPLFNKEEAEKSFATIKEAQNILKTGQSHYMESLDLYHSR